VIERYKPEFVRLIRKLDRGPTEPTIRGGNLMAYLNSDNPRRGPLRKTMRGKSKRKH
jgi:hypothetical protein